VCKQVAGQDKVAFLTFHNRWLTADHDNTVNRATELRDWEMWTPVVIENPDSVPGGPSVWGTIFDIGKVAVQVLTGQQAPRCSAGWFS